jgi:hypothetical protein
MAKDAETTRAQILKRKRPAAKTAAPSEVKDTKSNADRARSSRGTTSPKVQRDTRKVYELQPTKERAAIAKGVETRRARGATGSPTATDIVVGALHRARMARRAEIEQSQAQHDVTTAADRERVKDYFAAHPEILHPSKAKKRSVGHLATSIFGAAMAQAAGPAAGLAAKVGIKTGKNEVVAGYHHPVQVSVNTARGLRDTAAATPGGIVAALTTRPDRTIKAMADDWADRYGQSDAEQQRRFAEHGIAPELMDATLLVSGGGSAAGRGITAAAKATAKDSKVTRILTEPRPALRTGGGEATVQKLSPNAFKAVAERGVDKYRLKRMDKQIKGTDHATDTHRAPGHVVEADRANAKAGRTVEVTPRWDNVLGGAGKSQRLGVARLKSRAVMRLKAETHRKISDNARKQINGLTADERKAFA